MFAHSVFSFFCQFIGTLSFLFVQNLILEIDEEDILYVYVVKFGTKSKSTRMSTKYLRNVLIYLIHLNAVF